jgi:hypothetical protein
MADDIYTGFYEETKKIVADLKVLAESLREVDVPGEAQAKVLVQFIQRFHRLIGGMASIGFGMFSPISRKTSLLAEKCPDIKNVSIKLLMTNLYIALTDLSVYFINAERLREVEIKAPDIARHVEESMYYISVKNPQITTQNEIDAIMKMFGKV